MQKILIVDDHPLYREGMVSALRAQLPEFAVPEAESAERGLEALTAEPDIDLVLIDLRLPGMDGLTALRLYAERHPQVPRIAISGQDDPDLVKRSFDAGASGFIPKSMSITEVAAAIRLVLAGGVFVPPALPVMQPCAQNGGSALTLRQLEALRLLAEGYTNKEIASALCITERTAKAHVAAIFEALGAENRTQAVVAAQRCGLLRGNRS
jgi:DNA-binding NarL/FixJ family response regulator